MNETRQSLLLRAQTGEKDAWKDLTDLYRPMLIGWLNRKGVPAVDLEGPGRGVCRRFLDANSLPTVRVLSTGHRTLRTPH
jgi:hypothetical protein